MMTDSSGEYRVYILRCSDGTLYTGITNDLGRRVRTHNAGRGAKYTRSRLPVELIYSEPSPDKSSALRRELEIKAMPRERKLELTDARPLPHPDADRLPY